MKKTLQLLILAISITCYSQIPAYYNDVNLSLSGQALKNELASKVINTHITDLTYTPGVWDALKQTDLDPTDPSKVLLIYGWNDSDGDITNDRTRGVNQNGGGTGVWNREHVYSRSLGNPNLGTEGPGADAHHLRPCDAQRNSSRSNRKFAAGSGNSGITPQGFWYPGDEWKGDVARMMMYLYIRYGDRTLPINVGVGNAVSGDANMIDLFLQWNAEDPVSDLEKQRNPVLEVLQGNRNPFIDNPAFATQMWGGPQAEDLFGGGSSDTEAPTIPTNLIASNVTSFSTNLSWAASTDNVGVTAYNIYRNGVFLISNTTTSYSVSGLSPETTYTFYVEARDGAGNISGASSIVNIVTPAGGAGGNATDLFFSEYIEGSSFNKALEIANVTGAPVNLSAYTIKKQTNGAGAWSGGLNLAGTLINGDVYVVANGSAATSIQNVADVLTGSGEVTFNGNDAVGLFKNDVLIDILGTFNGGTGNFAQNTTLVRQPNINSPSTTYLVTEWDSFPSDTVADLGMHTFNGGGTGSDTEAPTTPASLVASNITFNSADLSWSASTDNVGVTGYDVYQNGVFLASTAATNYNVTGLTAETTYSFLVTAKDAAGNSSASSNIANATTIAEPDTQAPTAPAGVIASNISETSADLSWSASTDNIGVTGYDVYQNGVLLASTTGTNYGITGLTAETSYAYTITAKDAAGNISNTSNTLNIVTLGAPPGGNATDLFFSEYIEGSSFNKALEIANVTGSSVNLSAYTIKKQTNGAGAWSGGLNLAGTLINGEVHVVANSSAATAIQNVTDVLTGSNEVTFNGNDAIGLFKNDVLIDIIGTFNGGTANFAQNTTLVRQPTVSSPSTTYLVAEWDSFPSDTSTDLGTHTFNGAGTGPDTEAPTVPASLAASNTTEVSTDLSWTASIDNVGVIGYDVYQDGVFLASTTATNYNVTGLAIQTTYTFEVIAYDAANNMSLPSTATITTLGSSPGSTTVLHEGFFENGFDGWIDGGSDCSRYSGVRSFEGNYSIRLRDNSGTRSSMTLENIDVSSYDTVDVDFHFYSYSMENNEDFWLRYYDGSSWITVATFARGTDFENNNFYTATVTLDKANYNFVNNARFRFQCDASGNGDHIYIDEVAIKGIIAGGAAKSAIATNAAKDIQYIRSLNDIELNSEEDFIIGENPVLGSALQVTFFGEGTPSFRVINLLGQTVKAGYLTKERINITNLRTGIYILELNDGDELITKKFIKK